MENFGAEIGEFGGFVVGNFRDGARFGNEARVGGLDAVDVGPNDGFLGVQGGAENGRGIIRAAATERGLARRRVWRR